MTNTIKMLPSLRLSDIASSHYLHLHSVLTIFDDILQCSILQPQNYWRGSGDSSGMVPWRSGCLVPRYTESFCATQTVQLVKPKGIDNLGKHVIDNNNRAPLESEILLRKVGGSSLTWSHVLRVGEGGATLAVGQRTFIRCDSRTHRPLKFSDEETEVLNDIMNGRSSFGCDEVDELVEGLREEIDSGVGSARGVDFDGRKGVDLEERVITGGLLNFGEHVDHAALATLTTTGLLEDDLKGLRPTFATFNYLNPGKVGERVKISRLDSRLEGEGVDCVVKGEGGRVITHGHFRKLQEFVYDMGGAG